MCNNSLQIKPVHSTDPYKLCEFLKQVDTKYFNPHPFTVDYIRGLCGKDLYYVLMDDEILAYGFLRGWDAGWDDICLGVCAYPQGHGYGELMTRFLHAAAQRRGLERIRLHVDPHNTKAVSLYEKLGYEFKGKRENDEYICYRRSRL